MEVKYSLVHSPEVIKKDIPSLDVYWRGQVRDAIRTKLLTKPDLYGVPLRQSLKGLRKLRVGDYRVIYAIEKKTVKTFIIGHRSEVYKEVLKRLGL